MSAKLGIVGYSMYPNLEQCALVDDFEKKTTKVGI